ncbi:uncharacterized protein LOC128958870 [Oppia nitens]|uniref:uncharacterized protein LOC128958870 n=1 Tax=Oppia nitens TaxID=1686743 RepID=UPI0023D99361|nr:uncharacterized protein LOC128958870 [Oppia nitens]
MNKWLAPSSIHFLQMDSQILNDTNSITDSVVNELSQQLAAQELLSTAGNRVSKVPKMQVSEKDGQLFALNNSSLKLMLQLEKQGKLGDGLIPVEVVPLSKVPVNIQMAMIGTSDEHHIDHHSDGVHHETNVDTGANCGNCSKYSDDYHNITNQTKRLIKLTKPLKANQLVNQLNSDKLVVDGSVAQDVSDVDNSGSESSDDEEDDDELSDWSSQSSTDETLQCNVCDHTYATSRQLARHQMHRKHFGCSLCDTLFPSIAALQQHKQSLEHWSDNDCEDDCNHQTITDENNGTDGTASGGRPPLLTVKHDLERLL